MLKSLQAGRALAALAVVAFHLSMAFADPRYGGRPIGRAFTHHGNLGVDFFFVLSGFIILSAHAKDIGRPTAWATYAWRRFARVYPVYWIYMATFCLLLALDLGQVAQPPRDAAAWLSTFSLVRFSPDSPPLQVAWTLFHEVAFYAVFSLLIVSLRLGAAAMVAWAVACAAFSRFQVTEGASAFEVYTSAYNLEFICGMAAYGLYRWGKHPWVLIGAGLATLTGGLIVAAPLGPAENGLFAVGFALVIAGATIAENRGRLPTPKALVALGGASYSLYLIHVPVIGVLLKVAMLLHLRSFIAPAALWWLVLLATTLIAYGAWLAIEKPIQSRLRSRARSSHASVAGAVAP